MLSKSNFMDRNNIMLSSIKIHGVVCLSVCLFVYLFVCLFICMFVCMLVCLIVCQYLSESPFVRTSQYSELPRLVLLEHFGEKKFSFIFKLDNLPDSLDKVYCQSCPIGAGPLDKLFVL